MRLFIMIAVACVTYTVGTSQAQYDVTVELQAYPTGLIPGVRLSKSIGPKSSLLLRLGYNWFRHRDLGVHHDERGGGVGGTIGYVRFFKEGHKGWQIGIKNDIWFNEVDWSDETPIAPGEPLQGETSITVLQPTVELGYTFLNNANVVITPTLAFGFEWNVRTNGAPTGEGAILLAGLQIGKRF